MSDSAAPSPAAAAAAENNCGVDVSKATLDVCLLDAAGRAAARRFDNDAAGVAALVAWLKPLGPGRVAPKNGAPKNGAPKNGAPKNGDAVRLAKGCC